MGTALPRKFSFILDKNLAGANCTENRVCTSCNTVVFGIIIYYYSSHIAKYIYGTDIHKSHIYNNIHANTYAYVYI